jgi:hypothetical protein
MDSRLRGNDGPEHVADNLDDGSPADHRGALTTSLIPHCTIHCNPTPFSVKIVDSALGTAHFARFKLPAI